jgi:hypothetical protein
MELVMVDTKQIAELEREAFGFGSIQARGNLVRLIGEADADTRAQAWGLRNLRDYKTKGVQPGTVYEPDPNRPAVTVTAEKPHVDVSKNPWASESWDPAKQISCVKGLGIAKASEIARAAGSFVGATSPTSKNLTSYR